MYAVTLLFESLVMVLLGGSCSFLLCPWSVTESSE